MANLPSEGIYWRVSDSQTAAQKLAASDWTLDADGVITPTTGQDIDIVCVGPSDIATITADTTITASSVQNYTYGFSNPISIDLSSNFTGTNKVYSMTTGPNWLSLDANTGILTGTAPASEVTETVSVQAANSKYSDTLTFNVTTVQYTMNTFPVDRIAIIGASNSHNAFSFWMRMNFFRDLCIIDYNKNVGLVEYAVPGDGVSQVNADLDANLANEQNNSNVVFCCTVGGNNITIDTAYDDLPSSTKTSLENNYQSIVDKCEAANRKLLPFGLIMRNYNGDTLDDDPSQAKSNEVDGSYSYNETWIKGIISANNPEFIKSNGEMNFNHYEWSRSLTDTLWDASDRVHPQGTGNLQFGYYTIKQAMEASEGRYFPDPTPRDYTVATPDPDADIDIIFAPYNPSGNIDTASQPNINWIAANNTGSAGSDPVNNIGNRFQIGKTSGVVQADGTAAPNVSFIYGNVADAEEGTIETGDTSATLNNSALRSSWVVRKSNGAQIYGVIRGLEPNKNYSVRAVALNGVQGVSMAANAKSNTGQDSQNNGIITVNTISDAYGAIFFQAYDSSVCGLSGIQVTSGHIFPVPVNTILPVISGNEYDGSILTVSNGTWTNNPSSYTYQWEREGVGIAGATNNTYTLVTADVGNTLTCVVTATTSGGSRTAESNPTGTISAVAAPTNISLPVISGPEVEGQTLSTTDGTWNNTPTSYTYQWKKDNVNVSGATSANYLLQSGDVGSTFTVEVTAVNAGGNATAESAASGTIQQSTVPTHAKIILNVGGSNGPSGDINHLYINDSGSTYTLSNLEDVAGNLTGVDAAVVTSPTLNGNLSTTNATGSDSSETLANYDIQSEAMYAGSGSNASISVKFSNLIIGAAYKIGYVVSRSSSTRPQSVTINGTSYAAIDAAEDPISIHEQTNIIADNNGEILFVTAETASINYAYLNGISIEPDVQAPVNTVAPAITGTTNDGQTLTVSNGTWDNSPTSYTYQWQKDDINIVGATSTTYDLVVGDIGGNITCVVTAINSSGSSSVETAAVGPVTAAPTGHGEVIMSLGVSNGPSQANINHMYVNGTKPKTMADLVDVNGDNTGIDFRYNTFQATGSGVDSGSTGSNTLDMNNEDLQNQYAYAGSSSSAEIYAKFSNLDPAKTYTLKYVTNRGGGTRNQSVTINGTSYANIDAANNPPVVHTQTGLSPDGNNAIELRTKRVSGSNDVNFAYLNGISITPE